MTCKSFDIMYVVNDFVTRPCLLHIAPSESCDLLHRYYPLPNRNMLNTLIFRMNAVALRKKFRSK